MLLWRLSTAVARHKPTFFFYFFFLLDDASLEMADVEQKYDAQINTSSPPVSGSTSTSSTSPPESLTLNNKRLKIGRPKKKLADLFAQLHEGSTHIVNDIVNDLKQLSSTYQCTQRATKHVFDLFDKYLPSGHNLPSFSDIQRSTTDLIGSAQKVEVCSNQCILFANLPNCNYDYESATICPICQTERKSDKTKVCYIWRLIAL